MHKNGESVSHCQSCYQEGLRGAIYGQEISCRLISGHPLGSVCPKEWSLTCVCGPLSVYLERSGCSTYIRQTLSSDF